MCAQKEAQSLTFKITKMAAVWIYIFPHKNNSNCRKIKPCYSEHKCSRFRRIGTKFGVVNGVGPECVQKEAWSRTFKIFKMAATAVFNFSPEIAEKWSHAYPSIRNSEIIHSVEWNHGAGGMRAPCDFLKSFGASSGTRGAGGCGGGRPLRFRKA